MYDRATLFLPIWPAQLHRQHTVRCNPSQIFKRPTLLLWCFWRLQILMLPSKLPEFVSAAYSQRVNLDSGKDHRIALQKCRTIEILDNTRLRVLQRIACRAGSTGKQRFVSL